MRTSPSADRLVFSGWFPFRLAALLPLVWAAAVLLPVVAYASPPPGTRQGPSEVYDAVVVGSGPGGLVSAISTMKHLERTGALKREGRRPRVLLVEKRGAYPDGADLGDARARDGSAFSRDQVISIRSFVVERLRSLGVEVPSRYAAVHESVPWTGDAPEVPKAPRPEHALRPLFDSTSSHTMPIYELQKLLFDRARSIGVEMMYGKSVEGLAQGKSGDGVVELELEGREGGVARVRTRYVVGADGTRSRVRELAGIGTTSPEVQGAMLGVWLKRADKKHELVYPDRSVRGEASVLLGTKETLYGLFALPPSLGTILDQARDAKRDLSKTERAQLDAHVEDISSRLLGRETKVDRISPFTIRLFRAEAAASMPFRTLLVGDAVQSVNPHTGSGANIAMEMGARAGQAIAEAVDAPDPRAATHVFSRFSRTSVAAAREALDQGRALRHTFEEPSSAARRPRRLASSREGRIRRTGSLRDARRRPSQGRVARPGSRSKNFGRQRRPK